MADKFDLDVAYLKMAHNWSRLSRAVRKKVGCLIVKNGMIISDGFNGTPTGFDNACEFWDTKNGKWITKNETLHAESNAITKLAKSTQSSDGATIYITCSPCVQCSKLIIQAGIKRLVFGEVYKNDDGLKLLHQAGILTSSINTNNDIKN